MPAGRTVWRGISSRLYEKGIYPKIWLGDPAHDEYAKNSYKDCLVLDFYTMHKHIVGKSDNFKVMTDLLNDKYFHVLKDQVYKMMDRQDDFGVFGRLEREAFFYSLFFYFHSIVTEKKIDVLVASEGPHSPASMVLYGVCKILGLKTYHLEQNSITPIAHVSKDFYGDKIKVEHHYDMSKHKKVISDYVRMISDDIPSPYYMEIQKNFDKKSKGANFKFKKYFFKPAKNFIFKRDKEYGYNVYRRSFFHDNHTPLLCENFINSRKKELLSEYKLAVRQFNLKEQYIYIPLHYEPEKTSNPDGGDFYNVYDMISYLRSFVPNHIKIVLKEHYSQSTTKLYGYRGRSPLFYKAINSLNNVQFVDVATPSSELIKHCIFVATQTGSAALEASLMRKRSLVFGAPWFLGIPNIYFYKDSDSFENFIKSDIFDKESVEKNLLSYISDYTIPACVNPSGESDFRKNLVHI